MPLQFQHVYDRLNPAQKKAVDTTEGPVMVVAGPGTGKTQVLAARVANILSKTDTNPSSILALTFTDSAAKEMRERLVAMIGKTGYYVHISTFHAFCSEVIRSHPEYFPIDRGSEPLTDLERYDMFQQLIVELPLEVLKPLNRQFFYITDVMKAISDLKREGFLPADFDAVVAEEQKLFDSESSELSKTDLERRQKNLAKWHEVSQVYQAYQQRLREKMRYDFDDMITLVVEAFSKEELLLREYQENLHYFLVDEYQDTNTAQNLVVDLLASYWGDEANVFVVGDPNQAIYRFQGASIENVLGFVKRYQQAKVITLDYGYRCPQLLYDAAAAVIGHNSLTHLSHSLGDFSFTDALRSQTNQVGALNVFEAPSQTLETVFVAEQIKKLQAKGVPLEEIAILYRHNRDVAEITSTLSKWSIPFDIDGGDNLLENEYIRQLLTLFRVIYDFRTTGESEHLFEVMFYDWISVDKTLVMKVGRVAGKIGKSVAEVIDAGFEQFTSVDVGAPLTPLEFASLPQFMAKIREWGALDATTVFTKWFETVIADEQFGYLTWVLAHDKKIDLLNHLNSLFQEIKSLAQSKPSLKLHDFLSAMATMLEHSMRLAVEDLNINKGAVHLSTVHRAKGREWQHVFLTHCIDGKWGNNRSRELLPLPGGLLQNTDLSKKEQNEDERRLFYVGLTRAKQTVTITYPQTIVAANRSQSTIGSMFIEEAVGVTELQVPELTDNADEYLAKLLQPVPTSTTDSSTTEFFKALVKDFKLSVTALNTYLRDPREFVENVLLKVPRAKPEPMAFGSAIHSALEHFFKHVQETGKKQSLEVLLTSFESALRRELLVSTDFERRLKYGKQTLQTYWEQLELTDVKPLFIERFFGSGWSKTILDDIPLTGRIDRVDWLDQEKKLVRVIDYKTGKEKSVNYIEGKIAAANLSEREQQLPESVRGPYKRQLLFYKLLAELDKSFIPQVTQGVFEFVEPNPRGKIVSRVFELRDADVADLKALIKEVMAEIRALRFLESL